MSQSTADRFVQVAKVYAGKLPTVGNLEPSALYELAAPKTPPEVREEVEASDCSGRSRHQGEGERTQSNQRQAERSIVNRDSIHGFRQIVNHVSGRDIRVASALDSATLIVTTRNVERLWKMTITEENAAAQRAWDAYVAAKKIAERTMKLSDGIRAGRAWARFLKLFGDLKRRD